MVAAIVGLFPATPVCVQVLLFVGTRFRASAKRTVCTAVSGVDPTVSPGGVANKCHAARARYRSTLRAEELI